MTRRTLSVAAASASAWLFQGALVLAVTSAPASVKAIRSYSGPTSTRVVFDFSRAVAHVAPDSGTAARVVIAVPGEPVTLGVGLTGRMLVNDGAVDSVTCEARADGARFTIWLHVATTFSVVSVPALGDKPYRLVLDAARVGGEAYVERKISSVVETKRRERLRIVAVDAGHGGEDTGARGRHGVLEKRVTLAVARALSTQLNHISGIKAVLVRDGDYFVPLRDRYHIAEKMHADVFISIHCNSSPRRGSGNGTEVYFLSLRGAADQASQDFADAENAADLIGGVPPQSEDDLVSILYDVKRSSAMQQSQLLAESLLEQVAVGRIYSRGVKQAGFIVLKSVQFPSALVETAFINNAAEADLLANPAFQDRVARQIAAGVKAYFEKAGVGLTLPEIPAR